MTATTCDTGSGLLRAVLADPASDDSRLIYADYLDEQGEADRAEFIRVQVELAATDDPHSDRFWDGQLDKGPESYRRRKALRQQESALLSGTTPTGFHHWVYNSWGWMGDTVKDFVVPDGAAWRDHVTFRRGFVDEIRLPLSAFLAHARDLFAAHPITAVVLTDREPFGHTSELVSWRRSPGPDQLRDWRECLPDDLYDRLPGMPDTFAEYYRDSDKARAALSAACTAYGRRAAGLPPLE